MAMEPPLQEAGTGPAPQSEPWLDPSQAVFFDITSATLTAAAREKIRSFAKKLKNDRRLNVTLIGRTDDLGSKEICIAIAAKRTEVVEDELINQGVKPNQIRKHACGCETATVRPPCSTESCRRLRRSVELQLMEKS